MMNELMIYVNALKRIADSHYGKEVIFYDGGVWYSREHCRNLTPDEVAEYVYDESRYYEDTELDEDEYAEVTAKDCSPAVLDMLANLSQRIVSLERAIESANDQLDTLYRNQVKQAEGLERKTQIAKITEEVTRNYAEKLRKEVCKLDIKY
jgi:hypothetical protein